MVGSGQTGSEVRKWYQHNSEIDWKRSRGKMGREKGGCFLVEVGTTGGGLAVMNLLLTNCLSLWFIFI